jgi:hypothetical protein
MSTDPSELVYSNGIDPDGNYLLPPMPAELIAAIAQGDTVDDESLEALILKYEARDAAHYGVLGDETRLDQVGWGVLFAADDAARVPAMQEALAPLLALRREQAGDRYYELDKKQSYRTGESKNAFLKRHQLGPGPVDPGKLPYYVMIVGDPRTISFRFQYQLDVQFAVGRLHFDGDTDQEKLDRLACYARSVVEAERKLESGALHPAPTAALFGVRNKRDIPTAMSSAKLVAPLAGELEHDVPGWKISTDLNDKADKARLRALVGGADTPALLFTASHGLGLPAGDPNQLARQGALVCSDWQGPGYPVAPEHMFSAGDLDPHANLIGLIAFHFACFGAGTPEQDDFSKQAQRPAIAAHDFVARLPQTMLSHPGGAALAVVSHVDRAWGYSFSWGGAGEQRAVFRKTLGRMMSGWPAGAALEDLNQRYAEISTLLSGELENIRFEKQVDNNLLAHYWTANSDARNYVLLGDPAVRLVARK